MFVDFSIKNFGNIPGELLDYTAPANPSFGTIWFDRNWTPSIKYWDGAAWQTIGVSVAPPPTGNPYYLAWFNATGDLAYQPLLYTTPASLSTTPTLTINNKSNPNDVMLDCYGCVVRIGNTLRMTTRNNIYTNQNLIETDTLTAGNTTGLLFRTGDPRYDLNSTPKFDFGSYGSLYVTNAVANTFVHAQWSRNVGAGIVGTSLNYTWHRCYSDITSNNNNPVTATFIEYTGTTSGAAGTITNRFLVNSFGSSWLNSTVGQVHIYEAQTQADYPCAALSIGATRFGTVKGFLLPRDTGANKNLISTPIAGLQFYQTDSPTTRNLAGVQYYDGSVWNKIVATNTSTGVTLVRGTLQVSADTTGPAIRIDSGYTIGWGANLYIDGNTTTNEIGFVTNGNYRMKVFSAGIGIGAGVSSINAKAILDIQSTTLGVLLPRMTTAQINAIATPPDGLMVYNTTLNHPCFYDGAAALWKKLSNSNM